PFCIEQPGVTEVQVGGAIFSDMHYRTHYHVDFEPALTVLSTVTSRPTPTRIVVDAGKKTMSGDAAMPAPRCLPPVQAMKLSAERYLLMIHWDTVENHTVDFRQSPAFQEWRAFVSPYFAAPPVTEHFTLLAES